MSKTLRLVAVVAAIAAARVVDANGQEFGLPVVMVETTKKAMALADHGLDSGLLEQDLLVIQRAAPRVTAILKANSLNEQTAGQGAVWAWYSLRVGSKAKGWTAVITAKDVEGVAMEFGKLVVSSKPKEADIYVDDQPWAGTTDTEGFVVTGKLKVRVKKGTLIAEAHCEVKRGKVATFTADLSTPTAIANCQ